MNIFTIVGIGMIGIILSVTIRQTRPEMALMVSMITGLSILIFVTINIASLVNTIKTLADNLNINTMYMDVVFKVIGISYITQFATDVCKDAGEVAIASKIELAGKVFIAVLTLPIIMAVMELITGLIRS